MTIPNDRQDGRRQLPFVAVGLALLLFVLCFGQTPALRALVGLLAAVAGFVLAYRNRGEFVTRPVAVAMALWVAWCFVTVSWAANPLQCLRTVLEEALLPAGCFLAAIWVTHSRQQLTYVLVGQFAGLGVLFMMTVAIGAESGWNSLVSHQGRAPLFATYPGTGVATSHFAMSVAFMTLAAHTGWRNRIAAVAFTAMAIVIGLFAETRMYWLTLMALLAVSVVLYRRSVPTSMRRWLWSGAVVLAAILAASLLHTNVLRTADQSNIARPLESVVQNDPRWHGWAYWISKGMEHPLIGVGFGKLALRASLTDADKAAIEAIDPLMKGHPHNYLITIWVTTGTTGFALNMALFFVLVRWFLAQRRQTQGTAAADACAAGLLLVVALFVKNLTDDQYSHAVPYYFWTLLGLAYGLASRSSARVASAGNSRQSHDGTATIPRTD